MPRKRIALIGERRDSVPAHGAIPRALERAARAIPCELAWEWLRTDALGGDVASTLSRFDGIWCTPGSPYADMAGALAAIRFAREANRPFLGTCAGFQHAVIEYARHVLGLADADHAETNPGATLPLIAPLACSLADATQPIVVEPGTRLRTIYDRDRIEERYRCSYGMNPRFAHLLSEGELRVGAREASGEVRAVELRSHPFFVATLFQPERAVDDGSLPPVVHAFALAVCAA